MSGENGMPDLAPFVERCHEGTAWRRASIEREMRDYARACMRAAGDDAERWRLFTEGPYPICYRGEMFSDRESLNAAVDAAIKDRL